jgi:hypothetical protein
LRETCCGGDEKKQDDYGVAEDRTENGFQHNAPIVIFWSYKRSSKSEGINTSKI